MQSHSPHLPLVFNQEQVLSAFYEERKRRSNSMYAPHHSLLQKNSYFSNAFGQRTQQKQKQFNNTLGSRQLSRISEDTKAEVEVRKQTNSMGKRRANSEVNALQNIDMATLNKIVIQNTKNIKQEVLNAKDRARNHASRKQNLQELESSFKNLTGHEIAGFGTSKEALRKKTSESKNRKNFYDENTDVNLLKDYKQIYTLGSSSQKVGIGKNGRAKEVQMKFQQDEPLIVLAEQNSSESDKHLTTKIGNDLILSGQKDWGSSHKFKYDYLKQELKSEEFESPKFKTDFCEKQYKVFTHNKVDQSQKDNDCQQNNNTKPIKYDSLQTQKQFQVSRATEREKQLQEKLAELQGKYEQMQRMNSKQLKFIESVYKMRKTLENTDTDCNLKQLWRWVKNLPHSH